MRTCSTVLLCLAWGAAGFAADGDALVPLVRAYMQASAKAESVGARGKIVAHPQASIESVTAALRSWQTWPPAEPGLAQHELKTSSGKTLSTYSVIVPKGYDPAQPWPLILALAGGRGDGTKYAPFWQRMLKGEQCLVVCPVARDFWWHRSHALASMALKDTFARYRVDRNRVYITGMSNGGTGAWYMAIHNPDVFAAAAPMAGAPQTGPKQLDYRFLVNLLHVPVRAAHGVADETIDIKFERKAGEWLSEMGYDFQLDEIPNGDHGSAQARAPQLVEWLATKRRQANPTRIRYRKPTGGVKMLYWLIIGSTKSTASIEAEIVGRRELRLKTTRVRQVVVFLNSDLADLTKPIAVVHNDRRLGAFKPEPGIETLLASARLFRDPERLYPVKRTLKLGE